jgi:hypothetical protein
MIGHFFYVRDDWPRPAAALHGPRNVTCGPIGSHVGGSECAGIKRVHWTDGGRSAAGAIDKTGKERGHAPHISR